MSNMSYCRFYNTDLDLEDCLNAIVDGDELSEEEAKACERMIVRFLNFCADMDIIDPLEDEFPKRLREFMNTCICRE